MLFIKCWNWKSAVDDLPALTVIKIAQAGLQHALMPLVCQCFIIALMFMTQKLKLKASSSLHFLLLWKCFITIWLLIQLKAKCFVTTFYIFLNRTVFWLTLKITLLFFQQVRPQGPRLPPGRSSRCSPFDRLAWSVKDYWKSERTKSERSTTRYWQQSSQVGPSFKQRSWRNPKSCVIIANKYLFSSQSNMMLLSSSHTISWCDGLGSSLPAVSIFTGGKWLKPIGYSAVYCQWCFKAAKTAVVKFRVEFISV